MGLERWLNTRCLSRGLGFRFSYIKSQKICNSDLGHLLLCLLGRKCGCFVYIHRGSIQTH